MYAALYFQALSIPSLSYRSSGILHLLLFYVLLPIGSVHSTCLQLGRQHHLGDIPLTQLDSIFALSTMQVRTMESQNYDSNDSKGINLQLQASIQVGELAGILFR